MEQTVPLVRLWEQKPSDVAERIEFARGRYKSLERRTLTVTYRLAGQN